MSATHCIVLAGGEGRRLGGASKADIPFGGVRMLERVVADVAPFTTGLTVVAAPDSVDVPPGALRTLEDPPGGGPLAGIEAGLKALRPPKSDLVFVFAVDTPRAGVLAPRLARAVGGRDGAVVVGGEPPFPQFLQALYRVEALEAALRAAGDPRNRGVRRTLRGLVLAEVPASAEECRDVDTPEDLAWWSSTFGDAGPGSA